MSELSINTHPPVLPALAEFPAATVYEALGKCGGMSPDVRPMIREWREAKGIDGEPMKAYAKSGYAEKIAAERVGGNQAGWGA